MNKPYMDTVEFQEIKKTWEEGFSMVVIIAVNFMLHQNDRRCRAKIIINGTTVVSLASPLAKSYKKMIVYVSAMASRTVTSSFNKYVFSCN